MPSPAPADQVAPLSRGAWLAVAAVFALAFIHFWIRTTPVRLANADDVVFQDLADRHAIDEFTSGGARDQARFYYETPFFRLALVAPYEIRPAALFSLLRTAALAAQLGLAAWLVMRVTHRPACGAAFALFAASTLHLPPTFYPVLSYPFNGLGFCAVLAALHCHLSYVRRPGLGAGLGAGLFFLLAGLLHEFFLCFLPLFLALSWLEPAPAAGGRLRVNLAPLTAALAYTLIYLWFARVHPSTYDGTRFSPDLGAAAQVLLRQLVGVLPGFELAVHRPPPGLGGPLFRGLADIGATVTATPWPDVLLALAEGAALTVLLARSARPVPPLASRWPWLVAFAALLNLPVAVSAKYQVFIFHRQFPYAYAFYAFLVLSLVLVFGAGWLLKKSEGRVPAGLALGALGLLATALCLSAMASNHRVLLQLHERYN